MSKQIYDEFLDASGLNCPLPLLKAKQTLNGMESGQVLKVIATDSGSIRDFKAFADQSVHELLEMSIDQEPYCYLIKRG